MGKIWPNSYFFEYNCKKSHISIVLQNLFNTTKNKIQ